MWDSNTISPWKKIEMILYNVEKYLKTVASMLRNVASTLFQRYTQKLNQRCTRFKTWLDLVSFLTSDKLDFNVETPFN